MPFSVIDSFTDYYAFLSNFYPSEITYDGEIYLSVEHAFQAAKTKDNRYRKVIREAKTPGAAKKLGRRAPLREDWEQVKDQVMLELVRLKFQIVELENKLLGIYDKKLIEGNKWGDTYWGMCRGKGKNKLGKILMQVRDEIHQKSYKCGCESRNLIEKNIIEEIPYGTGDLVVRIPVELPLISCMDCGEQWTDYRSEILRQHAVDVHLARKSIT